MRVCLLTLVVEQPQDISHVVTLMREMGMALPSTATHPTIDVKSVPDARAEATKSLTQATERLSRAIGMPKPKLSNHERARVAAAARWQKQRAVVTPAKPLPKRRVVRETSLEGGAEESLDAYEERRARLTIDPSHQPLGLGLSNEDEVDGRAILEGAFDE